MSDWQKKIQDELDRPKREAEENARKKEEEAARKELQIQQRYTDAIGFLRVVGIQKLLEEIKRDVWKSGEVVGPNLSRGDTSGGRFRWDGYPRFFFIVDNALVFEYDAYHRVVVGREYSTYSGRAWEGTIGSWSGWTDVYGDRVLPTHVYISAGIGFGESKIEPVSLWFESRGGIYEKRHECYRSEVDARNWFEQMLLEDSTERTKKKMLPRDILAMSLYDRPNPVGKIP